MKKTTNDASLRGESPSQLIDARIEELGDWRGEMLSRLRSLIKQADPGVTEEWKWRGVPVWYHDGLICTGETYKNIQQFREDYTTLVKSFLDLPSHPKVYLSAPPTMPTRTTIVSPSALFSPSLASSRST